MRTIRLGLLGFGSVGQAFARLVADETDYLFRERGVRLVVTGVSTRRFGARIDASGLDLEELLRKAGSADSHGAVADATEFVAHCPADVIVETLPLEPFSGRTAIAATRSALAAGRHVVSADKGPVAYALGELTALADTHGVSYRFESAVADGLPVFNLLRHCLPAVDVTSFIGVLNSTSQLVLDAMADGGSLRDAVGGAQLAGIAEADPSHDLDGWDAAVKLAALSAAVWDLPLAIDGVVREPVDESAAIRSVAAAGRGHRLVSIAELTRGASGAPAASVRLTEIAPAHPFFAVRGASLALTITSRLLCPVTVSSAEPTVRDTAYGLLADVLTID